LTLSGVFSSESELPSLGQLCPGCVLVSQYEVLFSHSYKRTVCKAEEKSSK